MYRAQAQGEIPWFYIAVLYWFCGIFLVYTSYNLALLKSANALKSSFSQHMKEVGFGRRGGK